MLLAGHTALVACGSDRDTSPAQDAGGSEGGLDAPGKVDAPHQQDARKRTDALVDDHALGDGFVAEEPVLCQPVDAGSIFGSSACNACLAGACCQQVSLCLAPVDGGASPCALLAGCVAACELDAGSEASCEAACSEQHPQGISLDENVNDCLSSQCTGDAGGDACGAP
jgi:hypothetical protein